MAKVSYAGLKLKTDISVSTFDFQGNTIEVLNYLSMEGKAELITSTLQKAEQDGIYDHAKLELYFMLHIVYMYTNLSFTEKQKENEPHLYDCLKSNGLLDMVLMTMRKEEYDDLFNYLEETRKDILQYTTTAASAIQSIVQDLPKNAEMAAKFVEGFDKEKFENIIQFAKDNGQR